MSLPSRLFAALVVFALGCAVSGPTMRDLDQEPDALRAWFEREQSRPRAVLLLSPV